MKKVWLIVLGVVLVTALYVGATYNRLVGASGAADISWSGVETQLQRRFDLIPNLVESVKGAQQQEQAVFLAIAEARTRYAGAASVEERVQAANQVESALGRLLVIIENYPDLRSTEAVQGLMAELAGTENRIAVSRDRYNASAGAYNIMIRRFPTNVVAGLFGFSGRTLFEATAGADTVPQVDFSQ